MKHLYFRHSNGTYSFVKADVEDETYAWTLILSDIRKRNPDYEIKFTRNYTDAWGHRHFDVGATDEEYVIF